MIHWMKMGNLRRKDILFNYVKFHFDFSNLNYIYTTQLYGTRVKFCRTLYVTSISCHCILLIKQVISEVHIHKGSTVSCLFSSLSIIRKVGQPFYFRPVLRWILLIVVRSFWFCFRDILNQCCCSMTQSTHIAQV